MKRSDMVENIQADLEEMLEVIKNRPNAAKHQPERFANGILDMLEGFGMLPPGRVSEAGNIVYKWESEKEIK